MGNTKIVKTCGSFPNDDAVLKIIYLGLMNASKKWGRPMMNCAKGTPSGEGGIKSLCYTL